MDINRKYILEKVLSVLDPEKVSDERINAFRNAAALYEEWSRMDEIQMVKGGE